MNRENQDVVIFVGAGASRNSGAPVMTNFLDMAEDILRSRSELTSTEHFERVFRGWNLLRQAQTSVLMDMHNIEQVFGAFEMARIVGRLGDCESHEEIKLICDSTRHVIYETIRIAQRFPASSGRIVAPKEYEILAQKVSRFIFDPSFRRPRNQNDVPTIITTNYDCALDLALTIQNINFDYGFRNNGIPDGYLPLLKLHGSFNWFLCPGCEDINLFMIEQNIHQSDVRVTGRNGLRSFNRMTGMCATCEKYRVIGILKEPFIVPPTWRKAETDQLAKVWQQAAQSLSRARYILFIGYSFPESDTYLQFLLSLGLSGGPRVRRIVNINPDDGQSSAQLIKILAPSLASRVESKSVRFDQNIEEILEDFFASTVPTPY